MSDERLYENAAHWEADRYLGNEHERRRLQTSASLVPASAQSLLDVGTGNGAFLSVVEKTIPHIKAVGVERSQAAIESAVCRSPIERGSIDALPFEDRAFDIVSALEVVEHLPFGVFEKGLEELERVARDCVLISVPYREYRLFVRCPYCDCSFNPHFHMRVFDDARMRTLMPSFDCAHIETIKSPYVVGGEVLTPFARWIRARSGFFPKSALCPQCGYSQNGKTPSAESQYHATAPIRTARRFLPTRMRPKWIIGLYRRPANR